MHERRTLISAAAIVLRRMDDINAQILAGSVPIGSALCEAERLRLQWGLLMAEWNDRHTIESHPELE